MQRAASAALASVGLMDHLCGGPSVVGTILKGCGGVILSRTSNHFPFAEHLGILCIGLPAGNSDDSSDGASSDDEMDVAVEPCVCSPALSVQVPSSTHQAVESAAGSLELAAQEAQDPQLCQSVDSLLCDSLEALLF